MSSSNINHVMATVFAAAVRGVRCHCVASLTLLVWHSFITLDEDVQYIWVMRNKSPFKWAYFFLRYAAILGHVVHNVLFEALADSSNPRVLCHMWHAYIVAFTQALSSVVEFILAARVYALYNQSRRIAFLLLILILAEIVSSVRTLWLSRPVHFYGACLLILPPKSGRDQGILGFIVHCILAGLTMFKYFFALAGRGRSPLVSLLIRDTTILYTAMSFIITSVVILCGSANEQGVVVFYWVTVLFSLSGCRMVLSMERLARKGEVQLILTNEISIRELDTVN